MRGLFFYASAILSTYRLAERSYSLLFGAWTSEKAPSKGEMRRIYAQILRGPLFQLCAAILAWPVLFFVDSIRLSGESFRNEMGRGEDLEHYIPTALNFNAEPQAEPMSVVVLTSAILTPIIALLIIAVHAVTTHIRFGRNRQPTKRASVFRFIAYDQAAAITVIIGGVFILLSAAVAGARWPVDHGLAQASARAMRRMKMPGAENMCKDPKAVTCSFAYEEFDEVTVP